MLTIPIHFDDLLALIDQLSDEQKQILRQRLEAMPPADKPLKRRLAGLYEGSVWMSDDFDEPLPDEFWLGKDA
jgi:hypothetical protein